MPSCGRCATPILCPVVGARWLRYLRARDCNICTVAAATVALPRSVKEGNHSTQGAKRLGQIPVWFVCVCVCVCFVLFFFLHWFVCANKQTFLLVNGQGGPFIARWVPPKE